MNDPDPAFVPVVLHSWPSCADCLSWSEDGELALAAGEHVYILTPKYASHATSRPGTGNVGLRDWHSARIRTNVFRQREWPDQTPGPFHSFSLGEEQSLSTVAGLAWSPPGLGPHRRSVLAVLTSNHVLSIWESNGAVGEWTRVFVINNALGDHFGWANNAGQDVAREKRRVRAFAWGPPYRSLRTEDGRTLESKWGVHFLAVGNDDNDVVIFNVAKEKERGREEQTVEVAAQTHVPAEHNNGNMVTPGSLFHKAMMGKSPISGLSWTGLDPESSESSLQVVRRHHQSIITVQATLESAEDDSYSSLENNIRLTATQLKRPEAANGRLGFKNGGPQGKDMLEKKIEEARTEFDTAHGLYGNSITRKWGYASSKNQDAVCITLHPSDMVEYTTASMERSTILFATKAHSTDAAHLSEIATTDSQAVHLRVINWILRAADDILPTSPTDRYLVGIAASYAVYIGDDTTKQQAQLAITRLGQSTGSDIDQDEMDVDEPLSNDSLTGSDIEKCLICEALIPFEEDNLRVARCDTGHQYSKLQIIVLFLIGVPDRGQHDANSLCWQFKSQEYPSTALGVIDNFWMRTKSIWSHCTVRMVRAWLLYYSRSLTYVHIARASSAGERNAALPINRANLPGQSGKNIMRQSQSEASPQSTNRT
jgi:Transcription factor IIIC subunit delta N-term